MADSLLRLIFQGDTTDAKKAVGGLQDSFGELKDFAKKALAGITFAVLIKESYDLGVMLSETKVKIQTAIGDSGAMLEDTLGITRDLFKTTDVTFGQATDMMVIFRNTMGLTNDQIKEQKDAWESWMDITGKGPEILSATDQMMRALGVDTFEGKKEILDYTIAIQRLTPIGLDPLMSALTSTAPLMSAFGMSSKEQIAFLGFMASAGLDAGSATMMFNQAIRNVKTPAELYEMMNTIKNTTDDLEAAQIASDVFGARGGAKLAAALRSGKVGIDELVESLDKSTGAFDAAGKAVAESYGEKLGIMKNKLADIGMTIGEGLVTAAMPIVDWITSTAIPKIGSFIDMFQTGLDWIKKGWDALPEPIQTLIPILGGLGLAFVALKTILIGHPLILMATILAGVVVGVGLLMDSLTPLETKLNEMRKASMEEAIAGGAANKDRVAALERVKVLLNEAAALQAKDQTPETLGRLREIAAAINKEFPEAAATVNESTGQIETAWGTGIDGMKAKADELIAKVREIQTAEQAQATAAIEEAKGKLEFYAQIKTAAEEDEAAQQLVHAAATERYGAWSSQEQAALGILFQKQKATEDATKAYGDQQEVLAKLDGTYAGTMYNINHTDLAQAIVNIRALGLSWDEIKTKEPELAASAEKAIAGMTKAMSDGGISLKTAAKEVAQHMATEMGIGLGEASVEVRNAIDKMRDGIEGQGGAWKSAGLFIGLSFGTGIADGIEQSAPVVDSTLSWFKKKYIHGSLPEVFHDVGLWGSEVGSTYVAGIATGISEDTKIAGAVKQIYDSYLVNAFVGCGIAGGTIGKSFAKGIADGMVSGMESSIEAIRGRYYEMMKSLTIMPGWGIPTGGGGGPFGAPTGNWGYGTLLEPTAQPPIPMPSSFPYWKELRAFLTASWPGALHGEPQVSLIPSTMYKTATNFLDPSGKNWTIYPWGYAEGGLVTRPTWAPLAERGPEYVVPQGKLESLLAALLQENAAIRQLLERNGVNRFDQRLSVEVEAGPGSILELAAKGLRIRG